MKHTLPTLVVALVGLALAACVHLGKTAQLQPIGAADSGRTIQMTVGQTVTLRLAANLATGYRWQKVTAPDERVLIVVAAGYDRPAAEAAGAGGQAWWKLRATGAGETSIELRYARPWEPEEEDKRFTLSMIVK